MFMSFWIVQGSSLRMSGPLDEIVALAVAIEPRLLGPAVLAHEGVERLPDAPRRG
jgi:hypothetical protein